MKIKKYIYDLLDPSDIEFPMAKLFNIILSAIIVLNAAAGIIDSVEWIKKEYHYYLHIFEIFSVAVFTIEYILRMWTITLAREYKLPVSGRIKYFFSFFALIDLFSILPYFMFLLFPFDTRVLRVFRLLRIVRILKIARYSKSLQTFGRIFKSKKKELTLSFMVILFLIVMASSVIYTVENEAQPEKFTDIPECMYWSVITLTTVGYGDMTPVTPLGRFFTTFIALLGLGMIALPTAIISTGFIEEIGMKSPNRFCPHCGEEL
ncbi:hypothetical protein BH10BAC5_BH10BAC5_07200 [soil metagenome]